MIKPRMFWNAEIESWDWYLLSDDCDRLLSIPISNRQELLKKFDDNLYKFNKKLKERQNEQ